MKEYLESIGMSIRQLELKSGIPHNTCYRIVMNRTPVTLENAHKIAVALDMSLDEIYNLLIKSAK